MPLKRFIDWLLFLVLCTIWGSSFILMKHGLDKIDQKIKVLRPKRVIEHTS